MLGFSEIEKKSELRLSERPNSKQPQFAQIEWISSMSGNNSQISSIRKRKMLEWRIDITLEKKRTTDNHRPSWGEPSPRFFVKTTRYSDIRVYAPTKFLRGSKVFRGSKGKCMRRGVFGESPARSTQPPSMWNRRCARMTETIEYEPIASSEEWWRVKNSKQSQY